MRQRRDTVTRREMEQAVEEAVREERLTRERWEYKATKVFEEYAQEQARHREQAERFLKHVERQLGDLTERVERLESLIS